MLKNFTEQHAIFLMKPSSKKTQIKSMHNQEYLWKHNKNIQSPTKISSK